MNMWIVTAGSGQHIVIIRSECDLLTDADIAAIDGGNRCAVHKAVEEWRGGVLENLLDPAGELVRGLGPVVIFHGDNENCFQFFSAGIGLAKDDQEGEG